MAKQTLNNNVSFGEQRNKINENFTEVYNDQIPSAIRNKLTSLEGADRLDASAIKNLPSGGTMTPEEIVDALSTTSGDDRLDAAYIKNIPSGGSVTGLTPKGILFGKTDGTIDQDTGIEYNESTKSLSLSTVTSSETVVFIGDSILVYLTAPAAWPTKIGTYLGYTIDNRGVPSTSLITMPLSNIPTRTGNMKILYIAYGTNDKIIPDAVAEFTTKLGQVIDNAVSKGWAVENIFVQTVPGWMSLGSGAPGPIVSGIRNATITVTAEKGATLIDAYGLQVGTEENPQPFGSLDTATDDGVHPNAEGIMMMYKSVAKFFPPKFGITAQRISANGPIEAVDVKTKDRTYVDISDLYTDIAVIDGDGKIRRTNGLKDGIKFLGNVGLKGGIRQVGTGLPAISDIDRDVIMRESSMLVASASDENYGSLELHSGPGVTRFRNTTYNGYYVFFLAGNGGDPKQVLMIQRDLLVIDTNILQRGDTIEKHQLTEEYDNIYCQVNLLETTTDATRISNTSNIGSFKLYMANGIKAQKVLMAQVETHGRMQLQNGGTYTDIPSARLAINSTTEGFLTPRMTTSQRDAIVSPVEGLEIYNLTTHKKNFYNGTTWEVITSV